MLAYSFLAMVQMAAGYPEQALQHGLQAIVRAREIEQAFALAFAQSVHASLLTMVRDRAALRPVVDDVVAVCREYEFELPLFIACVARGYCRAADGMASALDEIRDAIARYRDSQQSSFLNRGLVALCWAARDLGDYDTWSTTLHDATAHAERTGQHGWDAELARLKGALLLTTAKARDRARRREAEECFRRSLDLARQQGAMLWGLRAATDLARLWHQQGKTREAREMLAEVYAGFSEGFDRRDWWEAKALLTELATAD
jgi:adenylate cyclase